MVTRIEAKLQYRGTPWVAVLAVAATLVLAGQSSGGGFYRLVGGADRPALLGPAGQPGPVFAVNHVHLVSASAPQTDLSPAYVDVRSAAIVAALRKNGFNALGDDADADIWHRGLPYFESLGISAHLEADQQTPAPNVYAANFADEVQALVAAAVTPRRRDTELIGYFSDDGLDWDPASHPDTVLTYYLSLPLGEAARDHATDFLRDRYGSDIRKLNRAWGVKAKDFIALPLPPLDQPALVADARAFAAQVLVRYLQTCADAIHASDAYHLYFGAGLGFDADRTPSQDAPAALLWSIPDVVSFDLSGPAAAVSQVTTLEQLSKKPLLAIVNGCTTPPSAWQPALKAPGIIGYLWNPTSDWQSGACAAEAQALATVNNAPVDGRQ